MMSDRKARLHFDDASPAELYYAHMGAPIADELHRLPVYLTGIHRTADSTISSQGIVLSQFSNKLVEARSRGQGAPITRLPNLPTTAKVPFGADLAKWIVRVRPVPPPECG
jgi:hypothetical protein